MNKHRVRIVMMGLLAVVAVGAVLLVQRSGHWPSSKASTDEKVYSAASDSFNTVVTPSQQAGVLEPAGVAKPLRLFGVKAGSSAKEGLAILGAAEASSRTYVAGALLENGARLTQLYSDHVVLVRDGRTYTLYMPQKGKGNALAAKSTTGLTVGGFKAAAPPLTPPAVRVSDAIRVAPSYEDGQVVGFHVYPGAKVGQMERWGLQSGDVLVSLSGQPLNTAQQIDIALEQLTQGASLQGEVRRGSERVSVTLDGATLMASASNTPPPMP